MDETSRYGDPYALGFGYCPRAIYASNPLHTRGRLFPQKESDLRTPFQRDRDRVIHSNAFRRLKHKTQVFVAPEGDHYRTRLTHSLEVAQIARVLARAFRLDEELAEAVALAHDLGHPPFGHIGEEALNAMMSSYGGFDHNAQSLRIVTYLEKHYMNFDGLNLSWETLEGIVKHNGPLIKDETELERLPEYVRLFNKEMNLDLDRYSSAEGQCAALVDDIASNAHDIDDGLRSGLLSLSSLEEVSITQKLLQSIRQNYSAMEDPLCGYELVRRQITLMVADVIRESQRRLRQLAPKSVEDIYAAKTNVIAFSEALEKENKLLKRFLYKNFYYHERVLEQRDCAQEIIKKIFYIYMENKDVLPEEWRKKAKALDELCYARLIADFISGMTDIYAIQEYRKFANTAELKKINVVFNN